MRTRGRARSPSKSRVVTLRWFGITSGASTRSSGLDVVAVHRGDARRRRTGRAVGATGAPHVPEPRRVNPVSPAAAGPVENRGPTRRASTPSPRCPARRPAGRAFEAAFTYRWVDRAAPRSVRAARRPPPRRRHCHHLQTRRRPPRRAIGRRNRQNGNPARAPFVRHL